MKLCRFLNQSQIRIGLLNEGGKAIHPGVTSERIPLVFASAR